MHKNMHNVMYIISYFIYIYMFVSHPLNNVITTNNFHSLNMPSSNIYITNKRACDIVGVHSTFKLTQENFYF